MIFSENFSLICKTQVNKYNSRNHLSINFSERSGNQGISEDECEKRDNDDIQNNWKYFFLKKVTTNPSTISD